MVQISDSDSKNSTGPSICIIGTGFSGICAAAQLQRKLKWTNFSIFEINHEVGGNWLVNTYPGCACDIQSHLYSYSFAAKSDWSKEFATQPEILEYIKEVAKKFDIYKYAKFRHRIKSLTWNEKTLDWKVNVEDLEKNLEYKLVFDIVINGSGELRIPEVPDEFKPFQGPTIHSARWDPTITLEGKTVGVVGSGATAIQLIPSIQSKVRKLLCYQRQPAWVVPSFQSTFTSATKWAFAHVPFLRTAYRSSLFLSNEFLFPVFQHRTLMSKIANPMAVQVAKYHIKNKIKDKPEVRKELLPNYRFGCKRVGLSNKYYRALNQPHVNVITSKISQVKSSSIVTEDGKEESLDILVLATGFRVHDYFAPMDIVGKNSENILQKWKEDGPAGYLGITSSCMPNHFMLLGPGSDVNHNSGIFQIECQVNWIIKVIKELIDRKMNYVCVKHSAEAEYMKKMEESFMKTVYGNFECGSWFSDSRGVVTALYPKSSISYWKNTRKVDFEKFDFAS